ncbi:MAG: hypothetical protein PHF70_00895 [Opitutales bacterium]|nr:hypothetical protein [Opitutales bacterium]
MQLLTLVSFLASASLASAGLIPLETELPKPSYKGTPVPIQVENLEPPRVGERPPIMVPEGTVNLSLGKPVTSSDEWPIIGEPDYITDGDKQAEEGYYVELGPDLQWVQIDLEQESEIHAIFMWHYHAQARVYHDVVVQIATDPDFESGVVTVFNNDHDNSAGMGVGKDLAYIESHEGRAIEVKGVKGQYVRLYSNGNTSDGMNHYIEVEVFGTP